MKPVGLSSVKKGTFFTYGGEQSEGRSFDPIHFRVHQRGEKEKGRRAIYSTDKMGGFPTLASRLDTKAY